MWKPEHRRVAERHGLRRRQIEFLEFMNQIVAA
jgi:hypothetical protein